MKKQTKSKKVPTTKMAIAMKSACKSCCQRQKVLAVVALGGLFLCGLMLGLAINGRPVEPQPCVEPTMPVNEFGEIADPQDVCGDVERLLLRRMPEAIDDTETRIERAKIYVSMAERGCLENSDAYAELARQELDIARAIEDDEFSREETIDVVETYKRLNMQAAAEEIFEKAKKLTDPAIDFIIQVEKIINE